MVGLTELGKVIFLHAVLECHKLFILGAVIADADHGGVDKYDDPFTLSHHLGAAVADELAFDAGADDRRLAAQKGHSLTHHVRSHEGAVSVVMFEEGDE